MRREGLHGHWVIIVAYDHLHRSTMGGHVTMEHSPEELRAIEDWQ
jgi:hypothetical protein